MALFEDYKENEIVSTKRVIHTPSEFAKKNLLYVQEAGYLKSLKSHLSKRSNLDSFLLCVTLSGEGTFSYENNHYPVSSGACFYADCQKDYSHVSSESHPWELMWVHFNGETAKAYYQLFRQYSSPMLHPPAFPDYKLYLSELIALNESQDIVSELTSSQLLTQLITLTLSQVIHHHKKAIPALHSSLPEKIDSIRHYLDSHYQNKVSLDELSSHFFISKYHMTREFKRITGITISHYIMNRRITAAKELLRFTNLPIEEIAVQCGFTDSSYFNRIFTRIEGVTGMEYRRKW